MADTNTERQADFVANQKRLGLRRTRLWVHKNDVASVKAFVAQLNYDRGIEYPPRKDLTK